MGAVTTSKQGNNRKVVDTNVHTYQTETVDSSGHDPSTKDYWQRRLDEVYQLAPEPSVTLAPEFEPVFAAAHEVRPTKLKGSQSFVVEVPAVGKSPAAIYDFTFSQEAPRNKVQIKRLATVPLVKLSPTTQKPRKPSYPGGSEGFVDRDAFWSAHADEHDQLFVWIESSPPDRTTTAVVTTQGSHNHASTFSAAVTVNKQGLVKDLQLALLAERAATTASPFVSKTYSDREVEDLQTKGAAGGKEKLGPITWGTTPDNEKPWVKQAIADYFGSTAKARDVEVDVVLNIPKTSDPKTTDIVLYSFRIYPSSQAVTVERVGPAKGPGINVFPKTLTPKPADWFKTTFGIEVLDADKAATRLTSTHGADGAGTRDFESDDLAVLAASLGRLSPTMQGLLSELRILRQSSHMGDPKKAGYTYFKFEGKSRWNTVAIYDSAKDPNGKLFLGGTRGVLPASAQTYLHEFGHVVSNSASKIESSFNAFVAKNKIKAVTKYGATAAPEFFAEAFSLFFGDPEWMENNLKNLFTWFATLSSTGKPP